MTYEQALEYIHSNHWQGKKPGLRLATPRRG